VETIHLGRFAVAAVDVTDFVGDTRDMMGDTIIVFDGVYSSSIIF